MTERIGPNQEKIRTHGEKETYMYLEGDTIKQVEMKEKIKKSMNGEREICSKRNYIAGINTRAVALVRYSGPFLKWTREELQQMDKRTRKL